MSVTTQSIELPCPAKINLSLSILGRRPDGFHDLLSAVSQVEFSDTLRLEWDPDGRIEQDRACYVQTGDKGCQIEDKVIAGKEDTVTRAIRIFREATGFREGSFRIEVEKRIPVGAGLGGGSSDGVSALRAMQKLLVDRVPELDLLEMSAAIGSDCPLFLADGPVVMEGRGDRISDLEQSLADRLRGIPVILFKPTYGISTADAYRRLAARECYSSRLSRQEFLDEWKSSETILPATGNDFERLCSFWIPDLAVVLSRLKSVHGLEARLSGSGSACFVLTEDPGTAGLILEEELRRAWGKSYWVGVSVLK